MTTYNPGENTQDQCDVVIRGDVGREKKAKLREAKQNAGLHQRFRVTGKYRRSQGDKRDIH